MILLKAESEAIANWVMDLDQIAFDTFLASHSIGRLHDFSTALAKMPVVAVAFVAWVLEREDRTLAVINAVVTTFPAHPSTAVLSVAAMRLGHQAAQSTAVNPCAASLVRGVPIVNRAALRAALSRYLRAGWRDVLLVDGPRGTGRTHSWHLIQHVAQAANVSTVRIDAEKMRADEVFDVVACYLGVDGVARRPTKTGATPTTLAERYVRALQMALVSRPLAGALWLVFDSADRTSSEEVRRFICELTEYRIDGSFLNCTIFLLGAARDYGHKDPHLHAVLETLSIFSQAEIDAAAHSVNQMGIQRLAPTDLSARCATMHAAIASSNSQAEAFKAVSRLLVELREEVQA